MMRRHRNVKIVATLGPASSTQEMIRALFDAGADVFRLNMSHGDHADHKARFDAIRAVEAETGRPIAVLADLQGPKLRVGCFATGSHDLEAGDRFRFDLDAEPGDTDRVQLPHPEIFAALEAGSELLVNDGKIRLRVDECGADFANCTVTVAGTISDRKGVNVPDVVLPLAAACLLERCGNRLVIAPPSSVDGDDPRGLSTPIRRTSVAAVRTPLRPRTSTSSRSPACSCDNGVVA